MMVDDDYRYRAVRSRDARFDGKFFTGVVTTGVYCRPVCPAKTPKRENVRFFACAAAAEAAGFRPCKRCRPETAPGTPAWNGTGTSVSRGIRLIDGGYLNERSLEDLAETLGMGSRHLRRLFVRHLGASPKAIDMIRKTHFAAMLLSETTLPIASVAFDAGFRSIRQFNDAFRASFGVSPTNARRESLRADIPRSREHVSVLHLSYRPPFNWEEMLAFLAKRAIRGVESVSNGTYSRSFSFPGRDGPVAGRIEVRNIPAENSLQVSVAGAAARFSEIASRVRRIFDLDADPQVIEEHLRLEPILAPLVAQYPGVRIPGVWDSFEAAIRAVVGQQISVPAAIALLDELAQACGGRIAPADGNSVATLFPTCVQLLAADLESLRMPNARKHALKAVAEAWSSWTRDGGLSSPLGAYRSLEAIEDTLLPIRGIGPWSAKYIALRGFSEPDAFPSADIGLRAAIARRLQRERYPSEKEVEKLAKQWRPWRGYAAVLLWQSIAEPAPRVPAGVAPPAVPAIATSTEETDQ